MSEEHTITLEPRPHWAGKRHVVQGRRYVKEHPAKRYRVIVDGTYAGEVETTVVSVEVGPASRTYVTARWEALRWHAEGSNGRSIFVSGFTRREAVQAVIARHLGLEPYRQTIEDLARSARVVKDTSPEEGTS